MSENISNNSVAFAENEALYEDCGKVESNDVALSSKDSRQQLECHVSPEDESEGDVPYHGGGTVHETGENSSEQFQSSASNDNSDSSMCLPQAPSLSMVAPPQNPVMDHPHHHQQQQHFHDDYCMHGSYLPSHYHPLHPPTTISNTCINSNLDATRQYFEAQMREHAMQYANAAAGAAWAAAQIYGYDGNSGGYFNSATGMMGTDVIANPYLPSYYAMPVAPLPPPMLGLNQQPHHPMMNTNSPMMMMSPDSGGGPPLRQKRTLWKPTNHSGTKQCQNKSQRGMATTISKESPTSTTLGLESSRDKKGSKKKRESGNDSLSSLGSESHELTSQQKKISDNDDGGGGGGASEKLTCENSKQRRRINDQEDEQQKQPLVDDTSRVNAELESKANISSIRQKRGLHHGQSSISSLSSNEYPVSRQCSSGRNKKKNRSHQPDSISSSLSKSLKKKNHESSKPSSSSSSSVLLGGLIGKNGVRALHELCSKYHWDIPTFTVVSPSQSTNTTFAGSDCGNHNGGSGGDNDTNNEGTCNDTTFLLSVHVNGVELGRGRAGSKSAAKQSASRKAFSALVPGSVFDPNGILTDIGGGIAIGYADGRADGGRASSANVGSKLLSLDELGPHLTAQLAIGGATHNPGGTLSARPLSPDHSETSSISTALSEDVLSGCPLISGGPLLLSHKNRAQHSFYLGAPSPLTGSSSDRLLSPGSYPCASTTSGVSSASDVDDEDDNAYYASRGASVCSTLLHAMWQIDDRIREPPSYSFKLCSNLLNIPEQTVSEPGCFKRAKVESPRENSGSRMFQCNASLNLYFPKNLVDGKDLTSIMNYWQSPLDYLQSNEDIPPFCSAESSRSRKRKDSIVLQPTALPSQTLESQERTPIPSKKQDREDFIQHKLESNGMGVTKRESKHKASAKMLSSLFPSCKSLVEVKAEAEAARELYAAKKEAQPKRAKLAVACSGKDEHRAAVTLLLHDIPAKSDISLTSLSLSESKDDAKQVKWSDSTNIELLSEVEVDATLQSMQELGEETSRDFEDIGKLVLRRAFCDDCEEVTSLLSKSEKVPNFTSEPSSEGIGRCLHSEIEADDIPHHDTSPDSNKYNSEETQIDSNTKKRLLGENSIILVLSRASAIHEPLLACAVLTVNYSEGSRSLSLCRLGHQDHVPLERCIEYIKDFAKNTHCTIEKCNENLEQTVPADAIRSLLHRSPRSSKRPEDDLESIKGSNSHNQLQSVKEEESEEVEEGSEVGDDYVVPNASKRSREF